jgi:hypothetical protein
MHPMQTTFAQNAAKKRGSVEKIGSSNVAMQTAESAIKNAAAKNKNSTRNKKEKDK